MKHLNERHTWFNLDKNEGCILQYTTNDGSMLTDKIVEKILKDSSNEVVIHRYGVIVFKEPLTSIGNYAFLSCRGLTSVAIPNRVMSIGEGAFYNCRCLNTVTIGSSVMSIDEDAFYGCTSLPVIDNIRYADCYAIGVVDKSLDSYTLKEGTRFIGSAAFRKCYSMTSITIPSSVVSIGYKAFQSCSGLSSVIINVGPTSIGICAFESCSDLSSVTIPNSVTSIRSSAFYGCSNLTSVAIPNSMRSIGGSAFSDCSALTDITYEGTSTELKKIKLGSNVFETGIKIHCTDSDITI